MTADKCTAANKAPKDGEITGLFFILDSAKKEPYYLCGVNPDGKLAPVTTTTGTATLPGKVAAKGCKIFPKGEIKFTPRTVRTGTGQAVQGKRYDALAGRPPTSRPAG
ncbi:hypothetical protein AB0M22_20070 [Nocardia sp. NPDC051756]|uniref:hypothetical protein n=1 Tax=Nocardia sp. NPDC051756 TaxID=3154751 RepID=UPI00341D751A